MPLTELIPSTHAQLVSQREISNPGFLWGAATAPIQVEGGITNDDWANFTGTPAISSRISLFTRTGCDFMGLCGSGVVNPIPPGEAVRFFEPRYYQNDFDYAKLLGLNSFRLGIEWSRIEPVPPDNFPACYDNEAVLPCIHHWNDTALQEYHDVLGNATLRGLTPLVSLWHWTHPLWVLTPPTHFISIKVPVDCPQEAVPGIELAGAVGFVLGLGGGLDAAITAGAAAAAAAALGICPELRFEDLPVAVMRDSGFQSSLGGWDNSRTVAAFLDFVNKVVPALKDQVSYWTTFNEPVGTYLLTGYAAGVFSPGFLFDGFSRICLQNGCLPNSCIPNVACVCVVLNTCPISGASPMRTALHNMIAAHVKAYDSIKQIEPGSHVGFTDIMNFAVPQDPASSDDIEAAKNFEYFTTEYFLNAVTKGFEDTNYLSTAQRPDVFCGTDPQSPGGVLPLLCQSWIDKITVHNTCDPNLPPSQRDCWVGKLDFFGLQYYKRVGIKKQGLGHFVGLDFIGGSPIPDLHGQGGGGEPPLLSDLGWDLYPQGIHDFLLRINYTYKNPDGTALPILITENGIAERTDRNRSSDIVGILQQIQSAMSQGVNVIGYVHWSLMDNWEWDQNYNPNSRFGLFHIDRTQTDPNGLCVCHRQISESAFAIQQIIADSGGGPPTSGALNDAQNRFGTILGDGSAYVPPTLTHGIFWQGQTGDETGVTIYLSRSITQPSWLGMIYWHDIQTWRRLSNIQLHGSSIQFDENWLSLGNSMSMQRQYHGTIKNGILQATFSDGSSSRSLNAQRIDIAGLWKWVDTGRADRSEISPWGNSTRGLEFYISDYEGTLAGKFFSYSAPVWVEMSVGLTQEGLLHLNAEPTFDLYLSASGTRAITTNHENGTWTANTPDRPFSSLLVGFTGTYVSSDNSEIWQGNIADSMPHLLFLDGQSSVQPSTLVHSPFFYSSWGDSWLDALGFAAAINEADASCNPTCVQRDFAQESALNNFADTPLVCVDAHNLTTSCGQGSIVLVHQLSFRASGRAFIANATTPFPSASPNVFQTISFGPNISGGSGFFSYKWDFGDQTSSTDSNPTHRYSTPGQYTITLTVTDFSTFQQEQTINHDIIIGGPVPDFTSTPIAPDMFTPVSFDAFVTGGTTPYTYEWDFGDGSSTIGNHIQHSYATAGTFNVRLTVRDSSNPFQTHTIDHEVVIGGPVVDFTFSASLSGTTTFSPATVGGVPPYTYVWDFGDGTPSVTTVCLSFPCPTTHDYISPGIFQVSLTVSDSSPIPKTDSISHKVVSGGAFSIDFQPIFSTRSIADGTLVVRSDGSLAQGWTDLPGYLAMRASAGFPIDVTGKAERSTDSNGWYNHPVRISWQGDSIDTGVSVTCDPPILYSSPDSANAIVSGGCSDIAGDSGTGNFTLNYDSTAPIITSQQQGQSFLLHQTIIPQFGCTDATSGVATCKASTANLDTSSVGVHSYTVSSTDVAGNSATLVVNFNVHYSYSQTSPASHTFEVGRTVPVRIQLLDAQGNPVSTATAHIWVDSLTNPGQSKGMSNTGNLFRYDATAMQYVYDLSTSNLSPRTHIIYITLDDGTTHTFTLTLVP